MAKNLNNKCIKIWVSEDLYKWAKLASKARFSSVSGLIRQDLERIRESIQEAVKGLESENMRFPGLS